MNVPPTREEPPKTRIWQPPPRTEPPKPGPAARQWSDPGPPRRPNSFLPPKNDVSCMLLPRDLYSINRYSLTTWLAVRVKVVYLIICFTLEWALKIEQRSSEEYFRGLLAGGEGELLATYMTHLHHFWTKEDNRLFWLYCMHFKIYVSWYCRFWPGSFDQKWTK